MAVKLSVFKNGGVHIFGKSKRKSFRRASIGRSANVGTSSYKNASKTSSVKSAGLSPVRPAKGSYSRAKL